MTANNIRRPRMIIALVWVFCVLGFGGGGTHPGSAAEGKGPRRHLVILHTNDTHGHPAKFFHYPSKDAGGLPARATLVRQIREKNRNVLVLDAGDINAGRPESNLFNAKPDIEGYNRIGYDAMTLGNHEFGHPLAVLEEQMGLAQFPFLSANVKTRDGRYLARPYVIKAFDGFKVAVFGLTTTSTPYIVNPTHTKGLVFEDEIEAAKGLVPLLRKKADVVIALTHLGLYRSMGRGSRRLAANVSGIDLIVDGHTHTKEDSPVWITSPSGDKTPIVQAWKWGLLMGRVDLEVCSGKVTGFRFETLPVNLPAGITREGGGKAHHDLRERIPEDEILLAMMDPYLRKVDTLLSEVIGRAEGYFFREDAREGETPLGNMVADSMLWATKRLEADFALQNTGGIRADIPRGEITKALIHEVIPFDNTIILLTLKGLDLQDLIAYMCTIRAGSGAFPQLSKGVRIERDRTTRRCKKVLIHGRPLDPKKTYRIATQSYLAAGGDGYKILLKAVEKYDTSLFQRDVLIDYIKSLGGRIKPGVDHRMILGSGRTGPPGREAGGIISR